MRDAINCCPVEAIMDDGETERSIKICFYPCHLWLKFLLFFRVPFVFVRGKKIVL